MRAGGGQGTARPAGSRLTVVHFGVDLGHAFRQRVGHGPLRPRAELVHAGRVAPDFLGGFQPGFARLAHHRRGGAAIKANHWPDKVQWAANLASFLWAAVKASRRIWAGVRQTATFPGGRVSPAPDPVRIEQRLV